MQTLDKYFECDESFFKPIEGTSISVQGFDRYMKFLDITKDKIEGVLNRERETVDFAGSTMLLLSFIIRDEITHSQALAKDANFPEILEPYGFNDLTYDQKDMIGIRTPTHLARLIEPLKYSEPDHRINPEKIKNDICHEFGVDFINYVKELDYDENIEKNVGYLLGDEGVCSMQFWTVAPHVHNQLKLKDNSANESMDKIFNWVINSKATPRKESLYYNHVMECAYISQRFVLGYDERGPTHLMANVAAVDISDNI